MQIIPSAEQFSVCYWPLLWKPLGKKCIYIWDKFSWGEVICVPRLMLRRCAKLHYRVWFFCGFLDTKLANYIHKIYSAAEANLSASRMLKPLQTPSWVHCNHLAQRNGLRSSEQVTHRVPCPSLLLKGQDFPAKAVFLVFWLYHLVLFHLGKNHTFPLIKMQLKNLRPWHRSVQNYLFQKIA